MFTIFETVCLAEWIIDDTCLVIRRRLFIYKIIMKDLSRDDHLWPFNTGEPPKTVARLEDLAESDVMYSMSIMPKGNASR